MDGTWGHDLDGFAGSKSGGKLSCSPLRVTYFDGFAGLSRAGGFFSP